jgi:hypothetical protein
LTTTSIVKNTLYTLYTRYMRRHPLPARSTRASVVAPPIDTNPAIDVRHILCLHAHTQFLDRLSGPGRAKQQLGEAAEVRREAPTSSVLQMGNGAQAAEEQRSK